MLYYGQLYTKLAILTTIYLHDYIIVLLSPYLLPAANQPIIIINIYTLKVPSTTFPLVSLVITDPDIHTVFVLNILLFCHVIRFLLDQGRYVRAVFVHLIIDEFKGVLYLYLLLLQLYTHLGLQIQDFQVCSQAIVALNLLRIEHIVSNHLKLLRHLTILVLVYRPNQNVSL